MCVDFKQSLFEHTCIVHKENHNVCVQGNHCFLFSSCGVTFCGQYKGSSWLRLMYISSNAIHLCNEKIFAIFRPRSWKQSGFCESPCLSDPPFSVRRPNQATAFYSMLCLTPQSPRKSNAHLTIEWYGSCDVAWPRLWHVPLFQCIKFRSKSCLCNSSKTFVTKGRIFSVWVQLEWKWFRIRSHKICYDLQRQSNPVLM